LIELDFDRSWKNDQCFDSTFLKPDPDCGFFSESGSMVFQNPDLGPGLSQNPGPELLFANLLMHMCKKQHKIITRKNFLPDLSLSI
jgi:hypothetical protein